MTLAPLDNLVKIGTLSRESPDQAQIDGLIGLATERLSDIETAGISKAGKFSAAYAVAHSRDCPQCDGTDIDPTIDTWCFSACGTRSDSKMQSGAYSINVTDSEIVSNMKAYRILMINYFWNSLALQMS